MATAVDTKRGMNHLPVEHREGCPADRLESYVGDHPRTATYPLGGRVHVTRCVDCGRDKHRDLKQEVSANG